MVPIFDFEVTRKDKTAITDGSGKTDFAFDCAASAHGHGADFKLLGQDLEPAGVGSLGPTDGETGLLIPNLVNKPQ